MADGMFFQSVAVGQGHVSAACIPVSCPWCGSKVRPLANDDPRGYSARERRLLVRCNNEPVCNWEGALIAELDDLQPRHRKLRRAG